MLPTFCQHGDVRICSEGQQKGSTLQDHLTGLGPRAPHGILLNLPVGVGRGGKLPKMTNTGTRVLRSLAPPEWHCCAGWSWALERYLENFWKGAS